MGSPEDEPGRMPVESPRHRVTVGSFYIAKFTVTQEEYEAVMGANPSRYRGAGQPVEMVSWLNAVDYCNRLSIMEGLTPAYTINGNNVTWNREANGYRLPTEAEWEYACRAGTDTPFYTGDSAVDAGWYRATASDRQPYPVGQKLPNGFGLYDMHGNVWEWCWDWYGDYTEEEKVDPVGPATGPGRVYRGGSWDNDAAQIRSAYRFRQGPQFRSFFVGFRVARNAN